MMGRYADAHSFFIFFYFSLCGGDETLQRTRSSVWRIKRTDVYYNQAKRKKKYECLGWCGNIYIIHIAEIQ